MTNSQRLLVLRFKDISEIKSFSFDEIEATSKCSGHQFFGIDGTENAILTPPHKITESITYVVTYKGIYDTILGQKANRANMVDGKDFLKSIKYESKKIFKDYQFLIRKTRNKPKPPVDEGYKIACFSILESDLPMLRKSDFFGTIVSFLEGRSSELLGSIDGLQISPVRFGPSLRGAKDVILDGTSVSVVRLSSGENYTCHAVESLLSEPPVIERVDGKVRKEDRVEDVGMGLYLRALGFSITKVEKSIEEYEHVY